MARMTDRFEIDFLGGPMDGESMLADPGFGCLPPFFRYLHPADGGRHGLLMPVSEINDDGKSSFYARDPHRNAYHWIGRSLS